MLSKIESKILLAAMRFIKVEDQYILKMSAEIKKKTEYPKNSNISENLYRNWVQKNLSSSSLASLSEEIKASFLSLERFNSLIEDSNKTWSIFFTFTKPGISADGQTALLQVTAFCPAGPPNFKSFLVIEKLDQDWVVKTTYGLYNQ